MNDRYQDRPSDNRGENGFTAHHPQMMDDATETIDLRSILTSDLSTSGSFDIRGSIWASTFGKLTQAIPIPVMIVDKSETIFAANQACARIGVPPQDIVGKPFSSLFPDSQEREKALSHLKQAFASRKTGAISVGMGLGDTRLWGRLTLRSVRIVHDRFILAMYEDLTAERKQYCLSTSFAEKLQKAHNELEQRVAARTEELRKVNEKLVAEIASRKRYERKLNLNRANFNSIVEKSPDGIVVVDLAGFVLYANRSAEKLLKRRNGSLQGSQFGIPVSSGGITNIDILREDGSAGVAQLLVERTDWNGEPAHLCMLRDITDLKKLENDLIERAYLDGLTGLMNRSKFFSLLESTCRTAGRYALSLSLCVCDLDYFKGINDSHGHQVGDLVLAGFAAVLKTQLRESDFAGRLGGDEFIVALPLVGSTGARDCMERVRCAIEQTVFEGLPVAGKVTVSAGIADFGHARGSAEELFRKADEALYEAKRLGRNRVVIWQSRQAV